MADEIKKALVEVISGLVLACVTGAVFVAYNHPKAYYSVARKVGPILLIIFVASLLFEFFSNISSPIRIPPSSSSDSIWVVAVRAFRQFPDPSVHLKGDITVISIVQVSVIGLAIFGVLLSWVAQLKHPQVANVHSADDSQNSQPPPGSLMKRNITIVALIFACITIIAFLFDPQLFNGSLRWSYFPAVVEAATLAHLFTSSGTSSDVPGLASILAYTFFYWIVFIFIYTFLLEAFLIRNVLHYLWDATNNLIPARTNKRHAEPTIDGANTEQALTKIGHALLELEARRRRHLFLQPNKHLNLSEAPKLLAARAITETRKPRQLKFLLMKLRAKLVSEIGQETAALLMTELQENAKTLVSQHSLSRKRTVTRRPSPP